jgi:hypothetical protein
MPKKRWSLARLSSWLQLWLLGSEMFHEPRCCITLAYWEMEN